MTNLIVEVSKYLMILLMAIYTYANFPFLFFPGSGTEEKSVCKAEPGHVFTAFSGICGDVSENRR